MSVAHDKHIAVARAILRSGVRQFDDAFRAAEYALREIDRFEGERKRIAREAAERYTATGGDG